MINARVSIIPLPILQSGCRISQAVMNKEALGMEALLLHPQRPVVYKVPVSLDSIENILLEIEQLSSKWFNDEKCQPLDSF